MGPSVHTVCLEGGVHDSDQLVQEHPRATVASQGVTVGARHLVGNPQASLLGTIGVVQDERATEHVGANKGCSHGPILVVLCTLATLEDPAAHSVVLFEEHGQRRQGSLPGPLLPVPGSKRCRRHDGVPPLLVRRKSCT